MFSPKFIFALTLIAALQLTTACSSRSESDFYFSKQKSAFNNATENATVPQQTFSKYWALTPYQAFDKSTLFELTDEQKADFKNKIQSYDSGLNSNAALLDAYMSDFLKHFNANDVTHSASVTYQSSSGNCMSLALLTASLADMMQVEYDFQIIKNHPVYFRNGDNLVIQNHIRVVLKDQNQSWESVIDFINTPKSVTTSLVTLDEFVSLYYRNKAADAFFEGRYNKAYEWSANVMSLAPYVAENINLHAVILSYLGQEEAAIELFEMAINVTVPTDNLYENYWQLLVKTDQYTEAQKVRRTINLARKNEPYYWLNKGDELASDNQLHDALRMYEKAAELAPYLDEVYLAQARVYYKLGHFHVAKKLLKKAKHSSIKVNSNEFYEAKLAAMTSR